MVMAVVVAVPVAVIVPVPAPPAPSRLLVIMPASHFCALLSYFPRNRVARYCDAPEATEGGGGKVRRLIRSEHVWSGPEAIELGVPPDCPPPRVLQNISGTNVASMHGQRCINVVYDAWFVVASTFRSVLVTRPRQRLIQHARRLGARAGRHQYLQSYPYIEWEPTL